MLKPENNIFISAAFTKNIFARAATVRQRRTPDDNDLIIQVQAPQTKPNQTVAITGNQHILGNWNPCAGLHLCDENFPLWEIGLKSADISFPLAFKFVVLDSETNYLSYWEEGENRVLSQPQQPEPSFLRTPELSWKACGTVIPVFSLRSEQSFGMGDLGDLKKLIDWAKITNQHVIQVLPMNDTTRTHTWRDSYPYSAISVYALHPLYINIQWLGKLKNKKKNDFYLKIQQQLNENETVDYPAVETYKTAYYRDYFKQEKNAILNDTDFQQFTTQNKEWLFPYAAFSYLRDKYQTADFSCWGDDARYSSERIKHYYYTDNEAYHAFCFLFFIQYTLHSQFDAVSRYARDNRVILKGDLPIGVNRESVEAWIEPAYFNKQVQAGAPPDDFSTNGQNWSFPTYNWDVMKQDDFSWWKKRFEHLQLYFDSIRIDHILGFFRIWEVPLDYTEGICGYFNPALPLQQTEIAQYGMTFDEHWLTPRVHLKYLPELFGDENVEEYLHECGHGFLALNENCSTQRKIELLFNDKNDQKSQLIRNGLMRIANEVLFILDNRQKDNSHTDDASIKCLYHPRISAYQSYAYRALSDENRHAFDRLYHDFFFNRHNDFWKRTALCRLQPLLNSTQMLVCGEDLGMIPATVQEVMQSLQILSLELERMSKLMDVEYTDLTRLPYHSVCTTSTHDMNPVRAWWTENSERTQRYYNMILHQEGLAPTTCTTTIAEQIVRNHLCASSILTLIPLQDWFAMDSNLLRPDANEERINEPTNPNHYWRYRMHITIETLMQSTDLNQKINALISESRR